jgi:hypothetical protein
VATERSPGPLTWADGWWGYVDLNHGPLPYQESSRASDVLRPVVALPLPSVNVHCRPPMVAAVVTQLVSRRAATHYEEESTRLAPSTRSLLPCSLDYSFRLCPTSCRPAVSSSVSMVDACSTPP